jgi:hypothetical protein
VVLGFAAPAFAAEGYWIVRGADDECTVVETEPVESGTITKVGKDVYVTREEAEADIAVVCD